MIDVQASKVDAKSASLKSEMLPFPVQIPLLAPAAIARPTAAQSQTTTAASSQIPGDGLNAEQGEVFKVAEEVIDETTLFYKQGGKWKSGPRPKQHFIFVHGGPGAGKSHIINAINQREVCNRIRFLGP